MYVTRMSLTNWRNFSRAEVPLGETTYILGPNASGKSNLLDVFRFMRDLARAHGGGLQQAIDSRGGLTKVRCLAARINPRIELEFEMRESLGETGKEPDWKYLLHIESEKGGKRRPIVKKEQVWHQGKPILERPDAEDAKDRERLTQTHLEQINANAKFRPIAQFFQDVLYLHLVPQLLKYGNSVIMGNTETDPFGQRFLEDISSTPNKVKKSRLLRIEGILKNVIPGFEELQFEKDDVDGRPHLKMRYNHWRPNAGWQREDQFSDGTLRLIALTWTVLASNTLILLEEPELSLHRAIVAQIPNLILGARRSRKTAGGQLLISTHSEAMLANHGIDGDFLILRPGDRGEATSISEPDEHDIIALQSGLTPADVLLPKTATKVGAI